MKILISGGGLAGLTAAYWLRKAGHTPVVIEHAGDLRRDGYGLDFFGTGYDVAERMGIIEDLSKRQIFLAKEGGIAFLDTKGNIKAELRIDEIRKVLNGKYMAQMHYDLEEVLYNTVKDDIEINFNTSIASVRQSADSVSVSYENGKEDVFDLLVGADGIHSNVRSLVFGPEKDFAFYLGYYLSCYFVPERDPIEANWVNYVEPGRQVGVYKSGQPGQLATLFLWQAEDQGYIPPDKRKKMLESAFKDMGWKTQQILDDMPSNGTEILVDTVTQIRMKTWRKGRVVLIGDAAGCMTLISGQGASMALGSAYVLAEELGREQDWQQALANYEFRVKPHIELRQRKAYGLAKQFVPGTKLGIQVQSVVLKLITFHAFSGLLKSEFMGDSFLKSSSIERLPESKKQIIGYRISGKMQETDFRTIELSLNDIAKSEKKIGLLLEISDAKGFNIHLAIESWQLGRHLHDSIRKMAIVGDHHSEALLSWLSERFCVKTVRHFSTANINSAWEWLKS